MKAVGCVFGCVEGCFFLSQTLAGHSVYKKCIFSFKILHLRFCFVTFGIWEMRRHKRNVLCFEVSILSARGPVSENIKS